MDEDFYLQDPSQEDTSYNKDEIAVPQLTAPQLNAAENPRRTTRQHKYSAR